MRPWTTYELAQQMDRSVGRMWSSATSVVYEEPKRLVRDGFARDEQAFTGKRASTVYSITSKGRRALAAWLQVEDLVDLEARARSAYDLNAQTAISLRRLVFAAGIAPCQVSGFPSSRFQPTPRRRTSSTN